MPYSLARRGVGAVWPAVLVMPKISCTVLLGRTSKANPSPSQQFLPMGNAYRCPNKSFGQRLMSRSRPTQNIRGNR
jgi:hypothetical protein